MTEPILVRAHARADDINEAFYLHRSQTDLVGPGLIIFIFSSFFAVAFFMVTALRKYPFLGPVEGLMHLICALISPAIPFIAIYVFQRFERKRNFSKANLLFLEPVTYAISEKGMQFINGETTFFDEWKAFSHAYDTPHLLFCVLGDTLMVLPKRDFADKEQVDQVRKILVANISQFSYTKGKRSKIDYLDSHNQYLLQNPAKSDFVAISKTDDSSMIVDANLNRAESANVTLDCRFTAMQLVEAHWKYVSFKSVAFASAISFLFGGILLCVMARQRHHSLQEEWPYFLTYLVFGVALIVYKFKSVKSGLRQAFAKDEVIEVSLSENEIHVKSHSGDLKLIWQLLYEFHETSELYCLIFGSSKYLLLIPKAALDDSFKKMYVENLLKRKTSDLKF